MDVREEGAPAAAVESGAEAGAAGAGERTAAAGGAAQSEGEGVAAGAEASALPVAGLGVDIVAIERMRQVLARTPRFKTRVYTDAEQAYCDAYKKKAHLHYATHFAAKEAVAKALGTGFAQGVAPRDIEVAHEEAGRPRAVLHGKARELAEKRGVTEVHLSLSRTHETAVANALAATEETRPQPKEQSGPTPREELASEFKKLRGMLDNLEEAMRTGLADLEDAGSDEATADEGAADEEAEAADAPAAVSGDAPNAALNGASGDARAGEEKPDRA